MTQPPESGRNRRAGRAERSVQPERAAQPAPIAPERRPRTQQLRQPIGRSQELLERERQLRQGMPDERKLPLYSDFDRRDHSARAAQPMREKRRNKHTLLWLMVACLCLLATGVLLMFAAPQLTGMQYANMPNYAFVNGSLVLKDEKAAATHEQYRRAMQTDRIFNGVYIDGIHVGGMTVQQAYDSVNAIPGNEGSEFSITVDVSGHAWSVNSSTIPLYRNTQEVVMQAWAVGRSNTTAIRGTGTTPFRQRLSTVQDAQIDPRVFYTRAISLHPSIKLQSTLLSHPLTRRRRPSTSTRTGAVYPSTRRPFTKRWSANWTAACMWTPSMWSPPCSWPAPPRRS